MAGKPRASNTCWPRERGSDEVDDDIVWRAEAASLERDGSTESVVGSELGRGGAGYCGGGGTAPVAASCWYWSCCSCC